MLQLQYLTILDFSTTQVEKFRNHTFLQYKRSIKISKFSTAEIERFGNAEVRLFIGSSTLYVADLQHDSLYTPKFPIS